jgi:diacylglycerol O-acyltransferase
MKRLNGMDAMLLYSETKNLHTHTLKVLVLDASEAEKPLCFTMFRQHVEDKLGDLAPLSYSLIDVPLRLHHPVWRKNKEIDLDYHLQRVRLNEPGGQRELDREIGRIASIPLDRTRPLWEFHFVEGLDENRFAVVVKMHHSLADGVASANILSRLMGLSEPAEPIVFGRAALMPTTIQLLWHAGRDHLRQLRDLPQLIIDVIRGTARVRRQSKKRGHCPDTATMFNAPPTFLNHRVTQTRTFATASLPLAEVKQAAKNLSMTFTELILAIASGGLRELMLRYDGRADRPLLATVPVCTDGSPDRLDGNEISGLTISLPVHVDDPLRRASLVSAATSTAKEDHDLLGPTLQSRMMAYLPPFLAPSIFRRQSQRTANKVMNVAISTVKGPIERGSIAGASVSEIYSVGVLSSGSALNMTAWSYDGYVFVAVLSDDETFNDTSEAVDAMLHSFYELGQLAEIVEEPYRSISFAMDGVASQQKPDDLGGDREPDSFLERGRF